jgi:hypothetical protein
MFVLGKVILVLSLIGESGLRCFTHSLAGQSAKGLSLSADLAELTHEIPGFEPAGITGNGTSWWILDGRARKIYHLSRIDTPFRKEIELPLTTAKGIAFDGKNLWVGDGARRLHYINAVTGKPMRSFTAPSPLDKSKGTITAVSWDGKHLWTAVAAGFSSSFNQIDPDTGRIMRSIFANCNPRGLAATANRLWSLCDNGPQQLYTLNEIQLAEFDRDPKNSVKPLGPVPTEKGAAGLFFAPNYLLTLEPGGHVHSFNLAPEQEP